MAYVPSLSGQSSIYTIISSLTTLARQPVIKLENKRSDLEALNGLYTDLKNKLSALRSAVDACAYSSAAFA